MNVAEYVVPDPEKLDSEPPEMERSDSTKSDDDSERLKEMDADCPVISVVVSDEIAIVGRSVSTVSVMVLSASLSSLLALPAVSENLEFSTVITPLEVLSAVGVKRAV